MWPRSVIWLVAALVMLGALGVSVVYLMIEVVRRKQRKEVVGFFHPFANDGGGGERVLWCAVKAVQEQFPGLQTVVYTGDPVTPQFLAERALRLFGVELSSPPEVVELRRRKWVEAATYPRFTLMGQSIGSVILGWEALVKRKPTLLIDTSGYAFIYPLARAVGCKVVCYTHYPTISSDMVSRVMNRVSTYNNKGIVSRSLLLSTGKTLYYKMMAWAYGLAGKCAHLAMVNSSWTQAHIVKLWGIPERTVLVYPPCDTVALQALPLERSEKNRYIISVAQFRPEKAHEVQVQAFALALKRLEGDEGVNVSTSEKPRLKLVGSCRHKEDESRLEGVVAKCRELGIADVVDVCKNVTYDELKALLGGAVAGLHTMVDEHFGISVVEYMAAGAVPIAHRSAGPKLDIVREEGGQRTGFLAATVEEFADAVYAVLTMPEAARVEMARASRQRAAQFSEARFDDEFKAAMKGVGAELGLGQEWEAR